MSAKVHFEPNAMPSRFLNFVWWNVNSFAHFERARAGEDQWPRSDEEYAAKCKRIDEALGSIVKNKRPQILALAEITEIAATDLRDRMFPAYKIHSLDCYPNKPELQVAIIYDPRAGFSNENIFAAQNVPRGTRPAATIDHEFQGHKIRFYACHWTARFREESQETRSDVARQLNIAFYDYLKDNNNHVVLLGDLNEEPFGLVEKRLFADRSRARAKARRHHTDKPLSRVRLYNCSWRWLGERSPHRGKVGNGHTAGTYYFAERKKWFTYDQVIVSGSLLTDATPYIDEKAIGVFVSPELLGPKGTPERFSFERSQPRGLSDHLPVLGRIVLRRGK